MEQQELPYKTTNFRKKLPSQRILLLEMEKKGKKPPKTTRVDQAESSEQLEQAEPEQQ